MARRAPRPRSFAARYAPLLVAAVAVLVLVALRTDDPIGVELPGGDPAVSADGGATTTTEADEPDATVPTSTTNPNVDDPGDVPASLRQALLTDEDLPSDWSPTALSDASTTVCPGQDPIAVVSPDHAVKASFGLGDSGPFLTSLVAEFDGDGAADEFLDALEDALEECDGLEDDNGLTYETERSQQGAGLGDRSVTATLVVEAPSTQIRGRILAVRVGDRVATIAFTATGDADAAVAVEALETVVGRLEG